MGGPGSGRRGTNSKGRPGAKGNIPLNNAIKNLGGKVTPGSALPAKLVRSKKQIAYREALIRYNMGKGPRPVKPKGMK